MIDNVVKLDSCPEYENPGCLITVAFDNVEGINTNNYILKTVTVDFVAESEWDVS